jgi:hypothetical protein
MKNISIITTREYVKEIVNFNKIWIFVFILVGVLNIFIGIPASFILFILGFFLALIAWYSNNRLLKTKGNVISKSVMDINTVRTSLLHQKIIFTFTLILIGFLALISAIADYRTIIGYLTFLIFILLSINNRTKLLSNSIKKK